MKRWIVAGLLAFIVTIGMQAWGINRDLSNSMIRFHVIANSDTLQDQALKLCVRDAVLEQAKIILHQSRGKMESEQLLQEHREELLQAAQQVVEEQGYSYPVDLEYGSFYFPLKRYGNVTLPSGEYDAFRIRIGAGEGQNWWCVMFPPLCFTEETTGELPEESLAQLRNHLSEEDYAMLLEGEDGSLPLVLRFKTVDWLMQLKEKWEGILA